VNSDLITDLNPRALRAFHLKHGGLITVAVTERIVKSELGVFEIENDQMAGFREKPVMKYLASCGVYCMEPEVLELIPNGVPFGFDDLMNCMLEKNLPVWLYRHDGLWLDIGREEDYRNVQQSFLRDYKMLVLGS
jgi:mannose-1-phosphate guanylyltransferase